MYFSNGAFSKKRGYKLVNFGIILDFIKYCMSGYSFICYDETKENRSCEMDLNSMDLIFRIYNGDCWLFKGK